MAVARSRFLAPAALTPAVTARFAELLAKLEEAAKNDYAVDASRAASMQAAAAQLLARKAEHARAAARHPHFVDLRVAQRGCTMFAVPVVEQCLS